MESVDFKLPTLYPFLKIYKAPDNVHTGEPVWTLHNSVANTYFRLEWAEFEILSRFTRYRTANELKRSIEKETTLHIDFDDIRNLIHILEVNGLMALESQSFPASTPSVEKIWQKILHGYLYFTIPLFKPQRFLEQYLPYINPILSKKAIPVFIMIFIFAVIMTLQRIDEFFHTFTNIFSLEGIIQVMITLGFVKVVHEMAHAFTAVKNGILVPHMGIAFVVLYPVLYTETTGSWQLSSRKARFEIGFAGIRAELFLAVIALLLWNIFPAGSILQTLCFMVVTVALVSSLLVNLNPLMRFDGYYMLSDFMGIENLQTRSCNFARWNMRRIFFGAEEPFPEECNNKIKNFLIGFGSILIIYRFFLFSGIAFALYHIFFKPLGLILMLVELWLFIIRPIFLELNIWWQKRYEFSKTSRSRKVLFSVIIILLFFILPVHRTISLPAISHASEYLSIYPPSTAMITHVFVNEGDIVRKGDVLLVMESFALEKDYELTKQNLENLENRKRRTEAEIHINQNRFFQADEDIHAVRQKVKSLQEQKDRLIIVAPFDGRIRDVLEGLYPQRNVKQSDLLLRIVDDTSKAFTAYIPESDLSRISLNDPAVFIPDRQPFSSVELRVENISVTNIENIDAPELSSCFGGDIQSECEKTEEGAIVPIQSLYRVGLVPVSRDLVDSQTILRGEVRIKGSFASPIINFIKRLVGTLVRESGLS